MSMIKELKDVLVGSDCQMDILIKYRKIWDKSRIGIPDLMIFGNLGKVSHQISFYSRYQMKVWELVPMSYITQCHSSITCNTPTRFRLAKAGEYLNHFILFFSVLVRVITVKSNQTLVMNSNESNKSNKRLLHKLIKPRHLNIPSNLVACFMGNCRPADESVINLISESYFDKSDTSIGFPSSIFESRTNSLLCQSVPVQQPSENENLFIMHINPIYEQDPRTFCQVFQPNVQECTMVRYVDKKKENVIEIECNIDGVESKLQKRVEIISNDQFHQRIRPILKKVSEEVLKHWPPLQLSFAPGRQLVTVFEYPSEDAFFRSFNENTHRKLQNYNNRTNVSFKSIENDGLNHVHRGPVLWEAPDPIQSQSGNHLTYSFSC